MWQPVSGNGLPHSFLGYIKYTLLMLCVLCCVCLLFFFPLLLRFVGVCYKLCTPPHRFWRLFQAPTPTPEVDVTFNIQYGPSLRSSRVVCKMFNTRLWCIYIYIHYSVWLSIHKSLMWSPPYLVFKWNEKKKTNVFVPVLHLYYDSIILFLDISLGVLNRKYLLVL